MIDIIRSSIIRTLKRNKMHPFKTLPTQELMEDDSDRRTFFREQMMTMLDNVFQSEHVLFSDECSFTLHGHANRQNFHYWSMVTE